MTDAISIPISVAISIGSGILSLGVMYGLVKSKIASIEKASQDLKDAILSANRDLGLAEKARHELELKYERSVARIGVLEHDGDERAHLFEKLEATFMRETRDQNRLLNTLNTQQGQLTNLLRTRTVSQEMRALPPAPIPRQEPATDPPGIPPMRKRLTTHRGEE
jgi:hypothetical protein